MQQTQPSPQAYLVIQQGQRWSDVLRLQPNQVVSVGRSSENQIQVKDERVSRIHAKFGFQAGYWHVSDAGSRNGTLVDSQVISGPTKLESGQEITVGPCRITFTTSLVRTLPGIQAEAPLSDGQTREVSQPSIVGRLSNSQWSREIEPLQAGQSEQNAGRWNYFYRLVFDLVRCNTEEQAANLALDRLLEVLGATAGGVLTFIDGRSESQPSAKVSTAFSRRGTTKDTATSVATNETAERSFEQSQQPYDAGLAVLAVRQSSGAAYRRVSDFLVRSMLKDRQAILARNFQDDLLLEPSEAAMAASGSRQPTTQDEGDSSILCVPLRVSIDVNDTDLNDSDPIESILGLLHIYTQPGQPALSRDDLELATGVADNLAIALSHIRRAQSLSSNLQASQQRIVQLEEQLGIHRELVGQSKPMQQVKQFIQRVAASNATVLVLGESGVGKELVARAIHAGSARHLGPLVCLNCAALAPSLLESELFGHEKGAFTGATERKIGKFEAAKGGTLFLDEIGEMPIELQAKFLRVLEGHPFERLGGNASIQSDVRVIAATNRNLEKAVADKEFRSDLFFRLRVIEVSIPPLRERLQDIPALVDHFLSVFRPQVGRQIMGLQPEALDCLLRHRWPGNVRELRNVIERAVVLGVGKLITVEDLNLPRIHLDANAENHSSDFQPVSLEEMERRHILAMLEFVEGNKSRAAQLLGIERSTLDRKLKRF